MKNLSLILNAVLLVAVAVLYYLHFASPKQASYSGGNVAVGDLKIAYINSDSVLKHYDYLKVSSEKLEAKKAKLEQELQSRAQSFQNDYSAYQRNVGSMTIGQAKAVEEDLTKKQQNLRMYQESLSQQLMGEEAKMTQELYSKVTDYLKKYGKETGIQVVLKYDPSSDVLYAGDSLDISNTVIKGLNEAYALEKSSAKPADSTAVQKKK
ncbi:MAG: outer membrane chaperone Skp [Azospira oryzae]|jgi:outer membrane protein|nr:MAG: outer membrane chaperone Skp [Azospira oryzae]